ncbi:MAG: orotate phosphoribosyltransferase [Negativicutes bacterium]|jgi:orotate phosphoribosyltransferase
MDFTKLLFQTGAVKVCPADKPFWYTSGMVGPYYVNTHFLYGSETKAKELLVIIDELKDNQDACAEKLLAILMNNYHTDAIFKNTIDGMIATLTAKYPAQSIDYISGGERRDWIFSLPVAQLLGIPHITMFKDLACSVLAARPQSDKAAKLYPTSVIIHIADLLNTASSYERAWVQILTKLGSHLTASLVVVDRNQGGGKFMHGNNIDNIACVTIDEGFFRNASKDGYISAAQLDMIIDYIADPKKYMKDFLIKHPEYLETAKDKILSQTVLAAM